MSRFPYHMVGFGVSDGMTKRLNLELKPDIDKMLREIAVKTGLKLVTIISKGIEGEYKKFTNEK